MQTTVEIKTFQALSVSELYEIMSLRQEVFVVEQNCPYLDADGIDIHAHHFMMRNAENKLIAYTRMIPEGISYTGYTSIGRVVNSPSVRGHGIGKKLMEQTIAAMANYFGKEKPIKIGAQSYLLSFYNSLGFESTGEEYLEDGIPHTKMIRQWNEV
jgi:ElaA protein